MLAPSRRSSEDPLPKLRSQRAEAPQFQVVFSRPADFAGRPDSRPNSFRWSGNGTIHLMERGLLIIAKRRSAMAFHTTQERFVPAAEICDVYREGNSVRVDLRGDLKQRDYFQFWTTDAATAGTIVRLLPTTRTIEYEGASAIPVPASKTPSPHRRRSPARSYVLIALTAGFIGTAHRAEHDVGSKHSSTTPRDHGRDRGRTGGPEALRRAHRWIAGAVQNGIRSPSVRQPVAGRFYRGPRSMALAAMAYSVRRVRLENA